MAYPNVPDVPGVPPLFRGPGPFAPLPTLMTDDSISLIDFSSSPQWGVFKNGEPVILFDTFVSIDYRQGWAIADYPLEQGAFESYDKVALPFDVRVKFASGGSEENRQALLDSVSAISKTLELYDVVTPEAIYARVNVQHYDYRRTSTNGVGMITIEMWLLEIRTGGSSTVTGSINATQGTATSLPSDSPFVSGAPPLNNTIDPSGWTPFNNGGIQPLNGTPSEIASFESGGLQ